MSLVRFMRYTFSTTFLILVYIHLQMQIVDLAYQGQRKEARIKDLIDKNGGTFYAISKLKSANHLGDKLLSEHSGMQFAGGNDIIYVAANGDMIGNNDLEQALPVEQKPNILASLLSFATQAEARIRE
ncbi:MAG TPA: hypothetical protein DE315_08070 [Candidatus Omnitrophica bacterium]|nr:MAG: hypothetical protein A2Y05_05070 [Omnitrophica WOR_2 bacterium GWA2_53_43]HBO97134.1 hypothetical protein [Candidatus Omnitrophota bacterium]HCI45467.1 hypothetical protein [Candidatus Omnitrophota bacterium]